MALIRRRRGGEEYWSFPGGGIKRGETPVRAARREVAEELGLDVRPERLLVVASGHALFLATIDDEPPLRMRGPEVARRSRRHRYRPEWLPLDQLADLDVRPRAAQVALVPLTSSTYAAPTQAELTELAESCEVLDLTDAPEFADEPSPVSQHNAPGWPPGRPPRWWAVTWRRWRQRAVRAGQRRSGSPSGRP